MNSKLPIEVSEARLVQFCQQHNIRKLAFFGSVLRKDFHASSDVDVLVEFEAGQGPGLIRLAGMEQELSLLLGRKADLNTPQFFHGALRRRVLAESQVHYVRRG
jgi:hypothetical protein